MQKITEKRILAVPNQLLLADGTYKGEIFVSDTSSFRVGQVISLSSDTEGLKQFQVKRVLKNDRVLLGDEREPIHHRSDVSMYKLADNASILAREQKRPAVPEQEIERHTYEEEPVVARRVVLVDKYGERISDVNPLPVHYTDGSVPVIYKEYATFSDATETTVATFVPTTNNSKMFRLLADAQTYGAWRVYRDSINVVNLVTVYRTSPMHGTCDVKLEQPEIMNTVDTLIITFQADRYRSSLLGASANTFTRLEGFIPS